MMMFGGNSRLSVLSDIMLEGKQMIKMCIAAVQNEIRGVFFEKMCLQSNLKAELEPTAFGH